MTIPIAPGPQKWRPEILPPPSPERCAELGWELIPASSGSAAVVSPDELARRFVAWMRAMGFTGWQISDDMRDYLEWFCDDTDVERIYISAFLAALRETPGVVVVRKRLTHSSDPELTRIRARAHSRQGRVWLYRVCPESKRHAARVVTFTVPKAAQRPAETPLRRAA